MKYRRSCNIKVIRFVSSPCSTGKTRAACKYIASHKALRNHLYVAPSLKLLNETSGELQKLGVKATIISSKTHPRRVKGAIIEFLKSALDCGHVLLITWNSFVDLPYFNRRSNWQIIVDEVPQVDKFYRLMLPHNHEFITEHLQVLPTRHSGLLLVKARNRGRLKRLLDRPHDDVDELFRSLFRDVLSSNKGVYVDAESWDRVAEAHDVSKQHEQNTIYFLSMLKPDPLDGAILLGANLRDSLLHHWFDGLGIVFSEEDEIINGLRSIPTDLGERLRISYFIPGRHISKALSRKEENGGGALIDRMDEVAVKEVGDEPFIYISNNDRESEVLADAPNAKRAPVLSNGLNSLQHFHNIYFSASLNREPKHFAMLNDLGLSSNLVHQATAHESIYQGVMRTSLRNPESSEQVHAIVPDEPSARRLRELLGCHEIQQIGDLVSPPKKPFSQTERSRRHQLGRLKEGIFEPKIQFAPKNQQDSSINQNCCDSGAIERPPNLNCNVTFHKTRFEKEAGEFVTDRYDLHDFIGLLRTAAKTKIGSKDELFLWNPAAFDPKGGEGYRKQEHFVESSFLVLDFDGGTLSPEELEDIFWSRSKRVERGERHSFIIHNSFSCSEQQPNKFRVIFFYRCPAQSLDEHRAAYHYVVRRLREWGHTEDSSKLDPACRSGVQSFWVPSINRDHPEFAFFRTYGVKTRDLARYAIDPFACPMEERDIEIPAADPSVEPEIKERFLAKAEMIETDLETMTCGRHYLFFMLGVLLAKGGLPKYEIETRLLICAGHETKMKRKIPGVFRSLRMYKLII